MGDVIQGVPFGRKPVKDSFQKTAAPTAPPVTAPMTLGQAQVLLDEFLHDPLSPQTRSLARQFVDQGRESVTLCLSGATALEAHGQIQDALDYCALIHRTMLTQNRYEHIGLPLLMQARILHRSKDGMAADLYALEAARAFMEQGLITEATAALELISE